MSISLDTGTANRDEIIRLLRDEGYRITQPRIAIVDAILATPGGFTADGLYDQLHGVAGIGRATVFRTVDTLAGLGYLRRLHGEEHCSQYIHTTPGHHHHLICTACHRVSASRSAASTRTSSCAGTWKSDAFAKMPWKREGSSFMSRKL